MDEDHARLFPRIVSNGVPLSNDTYRNVATAQGSTAERADAERVSSRTVNRVDKRLRETGDVVSAHTQKSGRPMSFSGNEAVILFWLKNFCPEASRNACVV